MKYALFLGDQFLCEVEPYGFDPDLDTNDRSILEGRIEEACQEEDYERAAKIRDFMVRVCE